MPDRLKGVSSTIVVARALLSAYRGLSEELTGHSFAPPVHTVYNPLSYAWGPFEEYHLRYAGASPRVLFLGMNPGPFGMVQTGIPFGDPVCVRDWLEISAEVERPETAHPKRPILGLESERREVSGTRLWGLFAERFGTPERFFAHHYVANYCPLAFLGDTGRNITPDKLPAGERRALFDACDRTLRKVIDLLEPAVLVGIGRFAEERLRSVAGQPRGPAGDTRILRVLHPSPASPAANRGWDQAVTASLEEAGVW
ncbi:MAG: uracil-DNA glycosylase family protein [Spirochaetota bacterium]